MLGGAMDFQSRQYCVRLAPPAPKHQTEANAAAELNGDGGVQMQRRYPRHR